MIKFKSLFKPKEKKIVTDQFSNSIQLIINQIDKIDSDIDDDSFYDIIQKNTSNNFETDEAYIFLPIVFMRIWLPQVRWKDEYIERFTNGSETIQKYNSNNAFIKINKVVNLYFNNSPKRNTVIQIAGKSAEFNAINQLLTDGGEIEDIKLTTTTILR
ncbi:hypothetical protein F7018_06885 [Tenacibaculum aiptasiae]|uniref:Uncharacterized protein n=1 Tax=Tenacibaculum aiptasiae TaxID=426481 RepID=A0A7J5AMW8_9FLAO|nr:hypothetical protein [Tenacibaculum aiptasiae]KAB1158825.1 hypothetical protein F7018_06885 [Tenacibaculum aiptasiae]